MQIYEVICGSLVKGLFTLRDETMWYWTHDSLITFINGLSPLKTKSGGGFHGGGMVGDVLGGDFVLRVPNLTHF